MSKNRDKQFFDTVDLEQRCYVLLACFLASPEIHKFCRESAGQPASSLAISESQVVKTNLIDIAIRLRMIDDVMRAHYRTQHVPLETVGELEVDGASAPAALTLREACNKILA